MGPYVRLYGPGKGQVQEPGYWGHRAHTVDSGEVDRLEEKLRAKIESLPGFDINPVRSLQAFFGAADVDGSGKITPKELFAAVKKLPPPHPRHSTSVAVPQESERTVLALFKRYDLNGSGTLDLKEFGAAVFAEGASKATSTIGKIREVLAKRAGGLTSLKSLGRQFNILDKDRGGMLTRKELEDGLSMLLRGLGVVLTAKQYGDLFDEWDVNDDNRISYDEFLRAVRGAMNKRRRDLVSKVWEVIIDPDKDGRFSLTDVAALYNVDKHPMVVAGKMTEDEALIEFMKTWDKDGDASVTLDEFIEYYEWISPSIDHDDYFELMVRNAWHLSGGEGWAANTSNRRVLCIFADGSQSVEEIVNDLGIGAKDIDKMLANLRARGINPVKIELTA